MKISYSWLKRYVDFDIAPEELSVLLTDCGLEVEGLEKVQSIKGGLEGIVIGEIKTAEKHPNADKLTCTTVDVGAEELLSIVCGAPNVAAGQRVPVATVGAILYSGDDSFQIKKSKIRGELSQGMICAEDELGLGTSHDGIMVLGEDAQIGMPAKEYFKVEDDYVFEIGLTPNRADATSHIGSARDVVAVINQFYPEKKTSLKLPSVEEFKVDNTNLTIPVEIVDVDACPRYSALTISGIEVKESPEWMQNLLKAIGVRPINNIVDITNFVLHETGHPLHAFNADKIEGGKAVIRKMPKGTKFTTLDEIERELTENDLMICDAEKGMCIGGVFGGINSGVKDDTKNIFLESAYFDPATIRKTAKYHGLQTDASFRFERGADPNMTVFALKRAAMLIKELAGGEITSEIIDVYPEEIKPWEVEVSYKNVDRLIGKSIERDTIQTILKDLEVEVLESTEEGLRLLVPTFKVDVTREADIIEEILRVYGYNNIDFDESLRSSISYSQQPDKEQVQNMIADYLANNNFAEIINNSLTSSSYTERSEVYNAEHNVPMLNPLSQELNVMRQSLMFGGLESIAYNVNRKNSDLNFFEFGFVYSMDKSKEDAENTLKKYAEAKELSIFITGNTAKENWYQPVQKTDFIQLKMNVLNVLKRLGVKVTQMTFNNEVNANFSYGQQILVNNKVIAAYGQLTKAVCKSFDIKQDVYYAELKWDSIFKLLGKLKIQYQSIPKFPEVRRDLAMLLDKTVRFEELEKLAYKTEKKLLKSVSLFDIYEGDKIEAGKKSYALNFILQDPQQTLTDKVVDKVMKKMMYVFEQNLNAIIRK
ncbi:MAG: phenylalanine--tRNA ligase subunit beta [Bacteroidetes bacterium]|nr:phenylalanine--tRNA ligase subunit beta [Bacteroidota bacterium]